MEVNPHVCRNRGVILLLYEGRNGPVGYEGQ